MKFTNKTTVHTKIHNNTIVIIAKTTVQESQKRLKITLKVQYY